MRREERVARSGRVLSHSVADADARVVRKLGEFPTAIRGAQKNAKHLCRAAFEE